MGRGSSGAFGGASHIVLDSACCQGAPRLVPALDGRSRWDQVDSRTEGRNVCCQSQPRAPRTGETVEKLHAVAFYSLSKHHDSVCKTKVHDNTLSIGAKAQGSFPVG